MHLECMKPLHGNKQKLLHVFTRACLDCFRWLNWNDNVSSFRWNKSSEKVHSDLGLVGNASALHHDESLLLGSSTISAFVLKKHLSFSTLIIFSHKILWQIHHLWINYKQSCFSLFSCTYFNYFKILCGNQVCG